MGSNPRPEEEALREVYPEELRAQGNSESMVAMPNGNALGRYGSVKPQGGE
jgi:hypothetical protein